VIIAIKLIAQLRRPSVLSYVLQTVTLTNAYFLKISKSNEVSRSYASSGLQNSKNVLSPCHVIDGRKLRSVMVECSLVALYSYFHTRFGRNLSDINKLLESGHTVVLSTKNTTSYRQMPAQSTGPNRVGFTWGRGKSHPLKRCGLKKKGRWIKSK
jgi:hypothetical protein